MRLIFLLLFAIASSFANDSLRIHITYPQDGDTLSVSRVRLAAAVNDSTATVTINDSARKVYPSGAFVDLFSLQPGWNEFRIAARTPGSSADSLLRLFRTEPEVSMPEQPTAFSSERMQPEKDITFYAPGELIVQFKGSPGGKASFEIDDLVDDELPMVELPASETGGIRGIYRGVYSVKPGDECDNERIIFYLEGMDGDDEKWKTERRVTVRQTGQPVLVRTTDDDNLLFYRPGSEIATELPSGITVQVLSETENGYRVALSENLSAVISRNRVELLPAGLPVPHAEMYGIFSSWNNDWLEISFSLSTRVPFRLIQSGAPQSVQVEFFQIHFQNEWTVYPETDSLSAADSSFLSLIEWQQVADNTLRFNFLLDTPQQWGYKARYEGNRFILSLRKPPVIAKENPFANLVIALDAGHGGAHLGAVGSTGYMEKDANLRYTLILADLLREAGAQVILTRDADSTMSLRRRADIAADANAHMLVWLHNNSTGITRHPEDVKGTSTYYTRAQGLAFAKSVYPELKNLGLTPVGLVHRSYYITRQTKYVVFLVEGAFMSNPDDEIFLMDEQNLRRLAQAVFNGIRNQLQIYSQ
jgi:N-acetylmuramoyl-L-alanine amidase